jgi:hypothetical protein
MTSYKAGSDVDTLCTKCDLELAHVIVAVNAGKPVRVQCKTCHTVHAFRGGGGSSARKPPTKSNGTTRASSGRISASAAQYDDLMQGKDLSRAVRYKPADTFNASDVLDHREFGIGLVTRVLADQKLEVLFRAGVKILAHARG